MWQINKSWEKKRGSLGRKNGRVTSEKRAANNNIHHHDKGEVAEIWFIIGHLKTWNLANLGTEKVEEAVK